MACVAKKGKCAQCNKNFLKKKSSIQCDACDGWFHSACQNVPDDHCDIFGKYESVKWYCDTCIKSVAKLWNVINHITARQDKLEVEIEKLTKKVQDVESGQHLRKIDQDLAALMDELKAVKDKTREMDTKVETAIEAKLMEGLENKIVAAIDTKLEEGVKKPSFANIVAQQVDSQFTKVSGDLNKVQQVLDETKKMADEEKDREGRSNNIIMYRVPECSTAEGRVKHDKSFSVELFNTVMELDVKDEDLRSIFRLGKWDPSNSTNRPLLIQFREKAIKNRVMESLSKLKGASDRLKNLSITNDMTKNERSECKRLVEEAKQKESDDQQGEFIWRVRGLPGQLKLIRFRKH